MIRPGALVSLSCALCLFACAKQPPPKSAGQRAAEARAKIFEMEATSRGEGTCLTYWQVADELEAAQRDLEVQKTNIAAGEAARRSSFGF